jgi:DNA-binding winged helix-turn-helix (wHTH) protein
MMTSKSFVFRFDDVEVREREFTLTKAGQVLTVEPKAFRALLFLLHNPQRLISKEELLDAVWDDAAVTEGSLTRCISLLRSRLGDDIRSPRYIETVATVGYRFKCTVDVSEEVPSDVPSPDRSIPEDGSAAEAQTATGPEGDLQAPRRRWLLAAAIIAGILASFAWYLHRPLPPPSITGYTQITHDGHQKVLVGTDGARLYFNQMSGQSLPASIAEVAISGGGSAQVPTFSFLPIPRCPSLCCGMFVFWEAPSGASLRSMEMPIARRFHRTGTPRHTPSKETSTWCAAMGQKRINWSRPETIYAKSSGHLTAAQSGSP